MEQFKNIQIGSTVYWLDKNALVAGSAIVKLVTAPHIQTVPTVSSSLVIDVTISIGGVDKLYTMPDTATVAYAENLVLATDRNSLVAECGKMKEEAEETLTKVDRCNAVLSAYDELILSLKPEEAERRDMNDRLSKLEDSVLPHGLSAYVEKNGWHFTCELCEWAIARLDNITKPIVPEGINERLSWDEIYTANMAKLDFYPAILQDDKACIAYAKAASKDSDGYDGMIFKRWLTDCGGRGIQINWDLFI